VPEQSALEMELAIEKLKIHRSPGIDKPQKNWLRQEVEKFSIRTINLLLLFGMNRNCLMIGRSR